MSRKVISLLGTSKSLNEFLGCKLGFQFRRVIIRRHEADCPSALARRTGLPYRAYSRTPMPWSALVSNNRIFRYVGHVAFDK
jgi:hypothetical protein